MDMKLLAKATAPCLLYLSLNGNLHRPIFSPQAHRSGPCNHGMMALGHVHSSSLRLRLASYHLAVFSGCPVDMMTPLACRDTPAPAAAPARRHHAQSQPHAKKCIDTADDLLMFWEGREAPGWAGLCRNERKGNTPAETRD